MFCIKYCGASLIHQFHYHPFFVVALLFCVCVCCLVVLEGVFGVFGWVLVLAELCPLPPEFVSFLGAELVVFLFPSRVPTTRDACNKLHLQIAL